MTSLLPRRTQPLDLMEFPMVSTDALLALDLSSSFTLIKPSWREGTFPFVLLKIEQSLSLRLPILMTSKGFVVHLIHFDHCPCAIVIEKSLHLEFVEASIGTLCDVFTPLRDASAPGR